MLVYAIRTARTGVCLAWFGMTVTVLALAATPHLLPYVGRELYVVRGGSMGAAMPIGSAVVVAHVDPAAIAVGDVITFRAPNGTVVTHRVLGVGGADGLSFSTKGDASMASDPVVVPADALIGRVELQVPFVGVLITVLASTIGAIAAIGLLCGLILAIAFLDELLATLRATQRRRVQLEPAHWP